MSGHPLDADPPRELNEDELARWRAARAALPSRDRPLHGHGDENEPPWTQDTLWAHMVFLHGTDDLPSYRLSTLAILHAADHPAPEPDPVLAAVLNPGRHHPVIKLERCRTSEELDLVIGDENSTHWTHMTADDLNALRDVLGLPSGRERALAALRYLAALDDRQLTEAIRDWRYESPDKALRLYKLLTGQAEPAYLACRASPQGHEFPSGGADGQAPGSLEECRRCGTTRVVPASEGEDA
jgi:hypothetical protein